MRRGSGCELWAQVAQIKSQKCLPPGVDFHQPCPPPCGKPAFQDSAGLGGRSFTAPSAAVP